MAIVLGIAATGGFLLAATADTEPLSLANGCMQNNASLEEQGAATCRVQCMQYFNGDHDRQNACMRQVTEYAETSTRAS